MQHGFGHEEWLFNFNSLCRRNNDSDELFKYGFLEPINKYYWTYQGQAFDVLLYTVTPERIKVAIGIIENLFVPDQTELNRAFRQMRQSGWIDQMVDDLLALGVSAPELLKPDSTADVFNVRFKPSDVTFFDPRILIPEEHKIQRMNRYQPLNWDDSFPTARAAKAREIGTSQKQRRSEAERARAAASGVKYSPQHVRLQNAMFDYLVRIHGNNAVGYEDCFVDLSVSKRSPDAAKRNPGS